VFGFEVGMGDVGIGGLLRSMAMTGGILKADMFSSSLDNLNVL